MKNLFLLSLIIFLSTSSSFSQYKRFNIKPAQYQSQYDENRNIRISNNLDKMEAEFKSNYKYIDNLIKWIYKLKNQTDDKEFNQAMNMYYKKLRNFDGKDVRKFTGAIRNVELGIREEIDKYNTRVKAENEAANDPVKYWNAGNLDFKNNEFRNAINNYNYVIQLSPNFSSSYLYRGYSYQMLGDFSAAIDDYTKFIELEPKKPIGYGYRGWLKYHQNNFFGALKDFNKQIELNPTSSEAYYNRGTAKSGLKDFFGSINDYKKAIELNNDFSMAYNNIAWSKFQLKKYSDALVYANKSIELDNNNYVAYDSRAEIKFNLKNYKGCIADCDTALQLNPKIANSYFLKGRSSYRLGLKQKACEYWSKAGELGKVEAYEYISKYCNN